MEANTRGFLLPANCRQRERAPRLPSFAFLAHQIPLLSYYFEKRALGDSRALEVLLEHRPSDQRADDAAREGHDRDDRERLGGSPWTEGLPCRPGRCCWTPSARGSSPGRRTWGRKGPPPSRSRKARIPRRRPRTSRTRALSAPARRRRRRRRGRAQRATPTR